MSPILAHDRALYLGLIACWGQEMSRVGYRLRWVIRVTAILFLLALMAGIAVWRRSGSVPSLLEQGRDAYRRGQWLEASDIAHRLLRTNPGDREGLRLMARSIARSGREAEANTLFSRLGKDALDAEDYVLLGTGLDHAGRGDAAVGLWEKALASDGGHPEAIERLASAYTTRNRLVEAAQLFERLARLPGWELRGGLNLASLRRA